MNYHKKIQTLGFKKIKPLVVCDYDSYREMIDGKKIISLDFENACVDILTKKVRDAIENTNAKSLMIGGGVIANTYIRKSFTEFAIKESVDLYIPEKFLTGDNAFMIVGAAIIHILNEDKETHISEIKADSNFSVENI